MKKIVSDILIVFVQLIVGGLFLWLIFSDKQENSKFVVINNDNLNRMADATGELFKEDTTVTTQVVDSSVVELTSVEEAAKKAQEEEEARRKAEEEEAARIAAEEEARKNAIIEHASGYISKPGLGFVVTTDNRTYSLGDGDFNIVAGVVACEAAGKDDALAVMSVILNRADARGLTPVGVVAQAGQFSCYNHPGDPNRYASVVRDALNGIRNNNYHGFNNDGLGVKIVDNGNGFR